MVSPLNQRRLHQFKSNKRGYYSFILFSFLFVISLFAEFIANDKPVIMYFEGQFYMPVLFDSTEQELGGELPIEPMYKDPFIRELVIEKGGWLIMPPIPFSYQSSDLYMESAAPAPPSLRHWLGTDDAGKDTLARLIYGFRLSVLFGISLTILSSIIGVAIGAVQGYFGGYVDLFGQRLVEIWTGLPILLILIILASVVKPNVFWLLGVLTLFSWMPLVGVVRAEVLRTRNFEYVRAARSLGVSDSAVILRHVLPNAMVATLTFLPFILSGAVTMLTALDFLGFGLPLGSPSLGELLAQGKANIHSPWLGLTGFFTLGLMLTLLIFIGEAVRDALDPRREIAANYQV